MIGIPLINGAEYSFADVNLVFQGLPLVGITGISYGDKENKENLYSLGSQHPTGRSYGKIEPNATITIRSSALDFLQSIAPDGRISRLPASPCIVQYLQDRGGKMKRDVLHNFEFTENKRDIKTGDNEIVVDIECIISHVEWSK